MTVRSAHEVAAAWVKAGGPASRQVEWVAIAMGESSLNDAAVSSAGAIGTWQIMPFNAHIGGGTVSDLYDLDYNAKVAVLMSGGGTNCAAWDSCYTNIYRSGRYKYLSYPEKGSADYHNIAIAAVAIGVDAVATALPEPSLGIGAEMGSLASGVQQVVGQALPQLIKTTQGLRRSAAVMYQPGWRAWTYSRR